MSQEVIREIGNGGRDARRQVRGLDFSSCETPEQIRQRLTEAQKRKFLHQRILIVDDHKATSDNIIKDLLAVGFTDVKAENCPHQGLAAILAEEADLVVLDLHMDGLNGFQILKKLEDAKEKAPGFILNTGSAMMEGLVNLTLQVHTWQSEEMTSSLVQDFETDSEKLESPPLPILYCYKDAPLGELVSKIAGTSLIRECHPQNTAKFAKKYILYKSKLDIPTEVAHDLKQDLNALKREIGEKIEAAKKFAGFTESKWWRGNQDMIENALLSFDDKFASRDKVQHYLQDIHALLATQQELMPPDDLDEVGDEPGLDDIVFDWLDAVKKLGRTLGESRKVLEAYSHEDFIMHEFLEKEHKGKFGFFMDAEDNLQVNDPERQARDLMGRFIEAYGSSLANVSIDYLSKDQLSGESQNVAKSFRENSSEGYCKLTFQGKINNQVEVLSRSLSDPNERSIIWRLDDQGNFMMYFPCSNLSQAELGKDLFGEDSFIIDLPGIRGKFPVFKNVAEDKDITIVGLDDIDGIATNFNAKCIAHFDGSEVIFSFNESNYSHAHCKTPLAQYLVFKEGPFLEDAQLTQIKLYAQKNSSLSEDDDFVRLNIHAGSIVICSSTEIPQLSHALNKLGFNSDKIRYDIGAFL